jgi:hypothetical protein
MLLLIGLQSGNGLHPDRILNCQNCHYCQKSPELVSADPGVLQVQFSIFGNCHLWQ